MHLLYSTHFRELFSIQHLSTQNTSKQATRYIHNTERHVYAWHFSVVFFSHNSGFKFWSHWNYVILRIENFDVRLCITLFNDGIWINFNKKYFNGILDILSMLLYLCMLLFVYVTLYVYNGCIHIFYSLYWHLSEEGDLSLKHVGLLVRYNL
jgi:hypothetical protein